MKYDKEALIALYAHQIQSFYNRRVTISHCIDAVIERMELSASASANKFYSPERTFSPFHSGQYCMWLYILSKCLSQAGQTEEADMAYCLNKALHAVDLYHGIDLPEVFGVEHPVGSVMGRATYSDHFFFYQGCTVGGSGGRYPSIGKYVTMFSNAKILGGAQIGNYVILAANTYVHETTIPDDCLVFGQSPNLVIKRQAHSEMTNRLAQFWRICDD